MKKILAILLAIFLGGCSGGIYSSLVEMEVNLASPILGLNDEVPVVYPYHTAGRRVADPMVGSFGPSWQGLYDKYPEYRFNP